MDCTILSIQCINMTVLLEYFVVIIALKLFATENCGIAMLISKTQFCTIVSDTVWHENFMVIKFYGLAILCKKRKFTDFNFTEPWLNI